jgi:hypothetical protein
METDKAALRTGDSWRAKVYRAKDEYLNPEVIRHDLLLKHMEDKGLTEKVQGYFKELHGYLSTLNEDGKNDDQTAGESAIGAIRSIHNELKETSFPGL